MVHPCSACPRISLIFAIALNVSCCELRSVLACALIKSFVCLAWRPSWVLASSVAFRRFLFTFQINYLESSLCSAVLFYRKLSNFERASRTAPATGDSAPAQRDGEHPSEATSPTAPS